MTRATLIAGLAATIAALERPHPVRVAVDGVDAAGKTTLADELRTAVASRGRTVIRASIDGFHNPRAIRRHRGPLSPEGYFKDSFNHAALIDELLEPLGPDGDGRFRRAIFDFRADQAVDIPRETAEPRAILILDGVFLLRPELRPYFDFSIFLRADFEVTVERATKRDLMLFGTADDVRARYEHRYVPGQRLYLGSVQPEQFASVVIDNNDFDRPVVVTSMGS
jgi:uridine kinase